jgi:2-iminoacetate synthase
MTAVADTSFIDVGSIENLLAGPAPGLDRVLEVIARAEAGRGLAPEEVAVLLRAEDPAHVAPLFAAARKVKDAIYGRRLVFFAPLYYSNRCLNDCRYCGFRRSNPRPRRRLSADEVAAETRALLRQGHKRILVIGGEEQDGPELLRQVIATVYATREGRGEVRRVNVESAPMSVEDFRLLKAARIGTYVCFQETYHPVTYAAMHPSGPKADYRWRLEVMDRAMEAGINDVGIAALLGLHDYRFEVLAMLAHARHLEQRFGAGPHTISVPRLEPADGAPAAEQPPHPVSDLDLQRIVAILRLAVPYTGLILSTREGPAMRTALIDLGISQLSAGSRTDVGGYAGDAGKVAQFTVGDQRSLDAVIADVARRGYVPSFCTGCYRMGRTGPDFMELAKPGLIRLHCLPNALFTFQEFLCDYATPETRVAGEAMIHDQLAEVPEIRRVETAAILERIRAGERDIYF